MESQLLSLFSELEDSQLLLGILRMFDVVCIDEGLDVEFENVGIFVIFFKKLIQICLILVSNL